MARRTLAQTRELLLTTGLDMLKERGVKVGVTHIRLKEVAHAAGLTTGAGYRCWPDQAAFHRELAIAAVGWRDEQPILETVAHIRQLVDTRAPLGEVIRVAAEANLFRYPEKTVQLNTITLRTCGPTDVELAKAGREHLTTTIESFASLYATLLTVYRLRMRSPYTLTDLTLALAALAEGFAVQAMTGDPHPRVRRAVEAPSGVAGDWSLLACAAEAIVAHFVEPEPEPARPVPPATVNEQV
jgi:AcrR family transcriptional regulator